MRFVKYISQIISKSIPQHRVYSVNAAPDYHNFPIGEIARGLSITPQRLESALKKNDALVKSSIQHWLRCFTTLSEQGFKTEYILNMVTTYPKLLQKDRIELVQSLDNWRNCQFGENNLLYLLSRHPHFLEVPRDQIHRRTAELQVIVTTKQKVKKLLEINPNVMFVKWDNVRVQLQYITDVMKVDVAEIYKSSALQLPISELKCRHVFLERLGLYKPKNPKASPLEPCTNAKLSDITDTSDAKFATKIAEVTLEEFRVFQEIFENEERDKLDHDSDDEDFSSIEPT